MSKKACNCFNMAFLYRRLLLLDAGLWCDDDDVVPSGEVDGWPSSLRFWEHCSSDFVVELGATDEDALVGLFSFSSSLEAAAAVSSSSEVGPPSPWTLDPDLLFSTWLDLAAILDLRSM